MFQQWNPGLRNQIPFAGVVAILKGVESTITIVPGGWHRLEVQKLRERHLHVLRLDVLTLDVEICHQGFDRVFLRVFLDSFGDHIFQGGRLLDERVAENKFALLE